MKSWGFYGGNKVEYDGSGFTIKMQYGETVYLEYNEASSLTSLLRRLIVKKEATNGKDTTRNSKRGKTKGSSLTLV